VFAHACGTKVAGVALVSNLAAGISPKPLCHEEVLAATSGAQALMAGLIDDFIAQC
jgi:purine-nucleoside phosphorylase